MVAGGWADQREQQRRSGENGGDDTVFASQAAGVEGKVLKWHYEVDGITLPIIAGAGEGGEAHQSGGGCQDDAGREPDRTAQYGAPLARERGHEERHTNQKDRLLLCPNGRGGE